MRMSLPSRAYGFVLALLPILAGALLALALPSAALAAEACPNEARRAEDPYSQALPDCRAYEQVSPVENNGVSALGSYETVHVAPSGEALTYTTLSPFPVGEGSDSISSFYMSARGPDGWSTEGLMPRSDPGTVGVSVAGETPDLSAALIESHNEPPLVSGALEGEADLYLRDSATGSYSLLRRGSEMASEAVEYSDLIGTAEEDSRIFFEAPVAPTPQTPVETRDIYEWHEGQTTLLDILPDGSPPSLGGAAGWLGAAEHGEHIGEGITKYGYGVVYDGMRQHNFYTQGAVSQDGSRVYFTDLGSERLYLREPRADPPRTVEVSLGPAQWRAATPDGSRAIYTEGAGADANLYRFTVEGERREALTSGAAGVLGVLGIGGDAEYVYFAATGVLASGAEPGAGNIYLWHDGVISLVTPYGEGENWAAGAVYSGTSGSVSFNPFNASEANRTAQVSENGQTLMFVSTASVTGYDNAGPECIVSEGHGIDHLPGDCNEVFIYSAGSHSTVCVSCDPSGAPARSGALLFAGSNVSFVGHLEIGPNEPPTNLSRDGDSVFFESEEALVPQDVNGQLNVYEWEREGAGSCPAGSGGCLYLISTGQSDAPSFFAGAGGVNGSNVLFFTSQSLVGQDTDELVTVYDARIDGGIVAQNPPASVAPCQGEACRPAQTPASSLGVPVSQVFSGPGNLAAQPEAKPAVKPKPKVKKKAKAKRKKKVKKKGKQLKKGKQSRVAKRSKKGRS